MNFNLKKGNCEVTITMDCGDDTKSTIHPDNLKKIDASNPNNPFEEVAELHDYAMKRIFLAPGIKEFNEDSVLEQLNDIFQKYPVKSDFLKNIKKFDTKEVYKEISGNFSKIYNPNSLYPPTPEQEEFLPPFLRDLVCWIFNNIERFDKTKDSLADFVKETIAYEQKIMDSNLDSKTVDASLFSLAIARKSGITYMEHFNQAGGDDNPTIFAKCSCKAVARVAIADCIGALAGIPGGAAGIVVGAVVGSGKQVIDEI